MKKPTIYIIANKFHNKRKGNFCPMTIEQRQSDKGKPRRTDGIFQMMRNFIRS